MEKEIDEIKNISAHILCICNLICVMGISNCGCVGWANSTLVVWGTTENNKTASRLAIFHHHCTNELGKNITRKSLVLLRV